ncbi:MAG: XRE family transcriptional regulator [Planctomycetota bacterium]|nr:MAG: XRE family transcriptional regulator [Planctomycetota bacterium]
MVVNHSLIYNVKIIALLPILELVYLLSMARPVFHLHPKARRELSDLGMRICYARKRRSLTRKALAGRAGISEYTLRRVESGEIGVTIGAYVAVLYALGLAGDLAAVAEADPLGRDLQDAALAPRPRRSVGGEGSGKAKTPQTPPPSQDTATSEPPRPEDDDALPGISSTQMLAYLCRQKK